MHDLEAAAKTLRHEVPESEVHLLAAQALEAWAWQQEQMATVQPYNGGWLCGTIDNSGHADTPLGAVRAAMEGEQDA